MDLEPQAFITRYASMKYDKRLTQCTVEASATWSVERDVRLGSSHDWQDLFSMDAYIVRFTLLHYPLLLALIPYDAFRLFNIDIDAQRVHLAIDTHFLDAH